MTVSDKNRAIWHSRRGMLELDLLLEPFARHCFETLSSSQQEHYRQLLSYEDQDLYHWLLQSQAPTESSLKEIIDLILAHARSNV